MGSLLTVGSRSTATAGVCLLIVLFSFGLFMNVNKPAGAGIMTRFPVVSQSSSSLPDINLFESRAVSPMEVGLKRSLLEAFPEVKEEENDTEPFASAAKLPKVLPYAPPTPATPTLPSPRHVIRLAGSSSTPPTSSARKTQQKFEIKPAGVFTVSYSPDPAKFVDPNGEHTHEEGSNSTFHLILDPRPDLDDADIENASAPVSSTHETQLEVASPASPKKQEQNFPPMIISLVIPDDIANGSNPLLLPEGLNPSNSLMEITCQVIDISITTSEQPGN
jgi:hypothetical protein